MGLYNNAGQIDSYPKTIYATILTIIAIVSLGSVVLINTEADNSFQSTTITNSAPVISGLTYGVSAASDVSTLNLADLGNGSSAEGTRFTSVVTATVNDNNGCADIDNAESNYSLKIYRQKLADDTSDGAACTITNGIDCYIGNTNELTLGSCLNSTDYQIEWPVTSYYFLDSTDAGGYVLTDWGARLKVVDDTSSTVTATDVFEVSTLLALDVDSTTDFGTLAVGASSASAELTIKNTGNVSEDFTVGYNQSMQCTRGKFSGDSVRVTRMKHINADLAEGMGSRGSDSIVNASIAKASTIAESSTSPFFAYIKIPDNVAVSGSCSNTATYTAIPDRGDGF